MSSEHGATRIRTPLSGSRRVPGLRLRVVQGADEGLERVVAVGRIRIGQSSDCDVILRDPEVSRRHCELVPSDLGIRVHDLGSTNGTCIDGLRIIDAYVDVGARIQVGGSVLCIESIESWVDIPLSRKTRFGALVGATPAMREVFAILERVAPTEATVLLRGETGTGKELAAEGIHLASTRARGPFVTLDCGAIAENLAESELFGHVRGAFTGATGDRTGVLASADRGTLFLDEIGELPLDVQPKLLRALEMRAVRPVGSNRAVPFDIRVIAATNRDLSREVNTGRFREDLYFRLAVIEVALPPLRARIDDLPLLVSHFVDRLAPERSEDVEAISESLRHERFPGNVRELRNAIERALVVGFRRKASDPPTDPFSISGRTFERPYKEALEAMTDHFEREYLAHALARHDGNVSATARSSELSRRYVQKLLRKHGLQSAALTDDDD